MSSWVPLFPLVSRSGLGPSLGVEDVTTLALLSFKVCSDAQEALLPEAAPPRCHPQWAKK